MKPQTIVGLGIALFLLATVACTKAGGEEMTMEEYFQELQALDDEAEQRSDDLQATLEGAVAANATDEERIAAVREFLDDSAFVFEDFLAGLGDLEPPDELRSFHDEGLSAGGDLVQVLTDQTATLGSDATMADVMALVTTLESDTSSQRFTDACFALQSEADKREIAVDLECEDEEG